MPLGAVSRDCATAATAQLPGHAEADAREHHRRQEGDGDDASPPQTEGPVRADAGPIAARGG